MRETPPRRRGFTLLEVMLAIVLAAAVVLMARQLLVQLTLSDRRLDDAARHEAQVRNTARFAGELLNRLEVGTDSTRTFVGEPSRAEFTTWCEVPRGWLERCRATIEIDTLSNPHSLFVLTSRGDSMTVRPSVTGASFRYVTDPEDHDTWVFRWGHGITAPLAIAIITPFDTTLIRIGPRG